MDIIVRAEKTTDTVGKLYIDSYVFDCTLGKNGITEEANKTEGDNKTPAGRYPIRYMYWRKDKNSKPETELETREITKEIGWCDDLHDLENYNKPIKLPYNNSHEKMWRDDYLYDYVVVLGHNDNPASPGKGSAIFMHIARHEFTPTAGCIGLKQKDLLIVLKLITTDSNIIIEMPKNHD